MKKMALLLCLLMSVPAFADNETIDLKKISQLGADIVDSSAQGIYKTLSKSSKNIANAECAIPTTAADSGLCWVFNPTYTC